MSSSARVGVLTLLLLSAGANVRGADPERVVVDKVGDWYLRESLRAIDDWEAILADPGAAELTQEGALLFPVPGDGRAVDWPNPIPKLLVPSEDRVGSVQLRVVGGKVQVRHPASEEFAPAGESVVGYHHPGGGGRSQWYHEYERKFDRLTHFQPQAAPFGLTLNGSWDSQRGRNRIHLTLSNVTEQALRLQLGLRFYSRQPERGPVVARKIVLKTITLTKRATQHIPLDVELAAPGGGLLVLTVDAGDQSYRIPLLTYVEDVAAVLTSIGQILSDTPSTNASKHLADLRERTRKLEDAPAPPDDYHWRAAFLASSSLRDELLLLRITFDRMLFVKRKPFYSEQPFMDAHHCYNRPGGGIYALSPVRPGGTITPVVDSLGEGIYRDVCLEWDSKRILFSFGNGSDRQRLLPGETLKKVDPQQNYNLYEIGVDGKGLRQLTSSPKNDCEPFYLPNGLIGFTSDRAEHVVMCGSNIHANSLYTMRADRSHIRQLSFNVFNEFNPSVLPDGRIIYNRWEYNERSVTSLHDLFTIHPDGTQVAPYYGNATIRPNVIMFPRAIPGSSKVMALFTGHHGQTHGPIGMIDVGRGRDGQEPITLLTPGVPVIGEKIEDSRRGWYSDPQPLSETTYLCAYTPTVRPWLEKSWGLYVGDRHGNLALVHRDPTISVAEPLPLVARARPGTLVASQEGADDIDAEATLLMSDVYRGLPSVERGEAKYLRILEDVPRKSVPEGGVICTSGTSTYTIKRIFGTVPIEADGSAHFAVPANRNLYFEVLDAQHGEIQRMRSVVCLKPNERRTCIGCHESQTQAPPNQLALALGKPPSRPTPPPWGTRTLSYLRDVQPVLNEKCVACHTHDRAGQGVVLTDDLTDQFVVGYEELLPYLSVANAMRWDHPDDVYARPAATYGSNASPLMKLLAKGHHGVSLSEEQRLRLSTWIDANAIYYDRYETYTPNRHIFTGAIDKQLQGVYAKRCGECHSQKDDGRFGTWWRSMNRRDVTLSRALKAPLARSAGGWQRCETAVFADTKDADYQTLLKALSALRDQVAARPRADLLSLRGTEAAIQRVTIPAPPPPAAARKTQLDEGWVYLSNLKWQTGKAGWTRNKDGLPRLDKDVENNRLRFGTRVYRKGIGTHAPSEIVYALEGRYTRFAAAVGGAEENGTVVFEVHGDDTLLYRSETLHGRREVKQVDVLVAGVRQLKLVVTDAGDGYTSDMANWADARLLEGAEGKAGKSLR